VLIAVLVGIALLLVLSADWPLRRSADAATINPPRTLPPVASRRPFRALRLIG